MVTKVEWKEVQKRPHRLRFLSGAAGMWGMIQVANKQQTDAHGKVRQLNRDLADAIVAADLEATQRRVQVWRQKFEARRLPNALDTAEGMPWSAR
jgi:hypothetical protein